MNYNSVQTQDKLNKSIVDQIVKMELMPGDKTRLADFAISRIPRLTGFAWQNWQCSIVAARVGVNRILYGVNIPNELTRKAMQMDTQVSNALGATATVEQMPDGKLAVLVQVPFQANVPNFQQLLNERKFKQNQYMFGYVNGQPKFGEWQDVLNILIAGVSQSGKTTTARFMIAQHLMKGSQFVVVDPQARAGQKALAASMKGLPLIAPIAIDKEQWLQAIAYVDAIGKARSNGNPDRTPVILIVDEANDLFDDKEVNTALIEMLKKIIRAYSKVGVNALVIGHDFRADSIGGSASLREMFQSRFVHQMTKQSAQTVIDDKDYKEAISKQKPGRAHLRFADGTIERVTIPETTSADLFGIAQLMSDKVSRVNPTLSWVDFTKQLQDGSGNQPGPVLYEKFKEVARPQAGNLPEGISEKDVLDLIAQGMTPNQIALDVFKISKGYSSQKTAARIENIIAGAVRWAINKGYQGQ